MFTVCRFDFRMKIKHAEIRTQSVGTSSSSSPPPCRQLSFAMEIGWCGESDWRRKLLFNCAVATRLHREYKCPHLLPTKPSTIPFCQIFLISFAYYIIWYGAIASQLPTYRTLTHTYAVVNLSPPVHTPHRAYTRQTNKQKEKEKNCRFPASNETWFVRHDMTALRRSHPKLSAHELCGSSSVNHSPKNRRNSQTSMDCWRCAQN